MWRNVRKEEFGLCEYVRSSDEWMLKVVAEGTTECETKLAFEKRMAEERWNRLKDKKLHGKFYQDVKEVADVKSWQ